MLRVILSALVIPLILSCSGTETVEPLNQPPTIEFATEEIAVLKNTATDLSVTVGDPDGDPLSVVWDISGGSLSSQNSANTVMRWTPPPGTGTDTIVVTVSDGEASASTGIVEIKRATFETSTNFDPYTFSKSLSPYVLYPSTETIGFAGTVTIEDSVEIFIGKPDIQIRVVGTLNSNGLDGKPVVIRPNARLGYQEGRGWWKGILVTEETGPGHADLEYTEIWHAVNGVNLFLGTSGASLDHCTFKRSSEAGVTMDSNGSLTVTWCNIFDNQLGIRISSTSRIPFNVLIENSHVHYNNYGLYMELNDGNQAGTINVRRNLIERNSVTGIHLAHCVWPTIENNDFRLNHTALSPLHIGLDLSFADNAITPQEWTTLPVPGNFWGDVFPQGDDRPIKETIYDREDNASVWTTVDVTGWLNDQQSPYDIDD